MTSQPDKLFREKLENFSTPAPSAAWSRIEAGLDQSNRSFGWMKIAASITLVSVATFLLWPSASTQLAEVASTTKPVESIAPNVTEPADAGLGKITSQAESIKPKNTQRNDVTDNTIKLEAANAEVLIAEVVTIQTESTPTEVIIPETTTQPEIPVDASQTITYSAEEVNAKFLKKEVVAEATTEEKKTSGIQKLIGVAYTLASADAGLGNIRQRKDEVLALNFRDKKQGQN
jgi:hypothetical protein